MKLQDAIEQLNKLAKADFAKSDLVRAQDGNTVYWCTFTDCQLVDGKATLCLKIDKIDKPRRKKEDQAPKPQAARR